MKKGLIIACCALLLTTGCGEKTKTMECTYSTEQSGLKVNGTYEVKYTGDYVDTVKTVEVYTVDSEDLVEVVKSTLDTMYEDAAKLDGYNYTRKEDGLTITSTVEADYTKIDMDKFAELDKNTAAILDDGKIKVSILTNTYKSVGATCKEK